MWSTLADLGKTCQTLAVDTVSLGDILLIAAEQEYNQLIKDILHIDPSLVGYVDHNGNSALAKAAWKNNWTSAHLLLIYGADPYQKNRFGYSPIMHARKAGHTNVLHMLQTKDDVYGDEVYTDEWDELVCSPLVQPSHGQFVYIRSFSRLNRDTLDRLHALDDAYLMESLKRLY